MATLPLLVEASELLANLNNEQLLIVDLCKKSVYQQAHLPHAVWVNGRDLVSGTLPAAGQLPSVEQLQQLFESIGLTANKHLVVYDDEGGAWAGRFIWTLDVIGHTHYSYLNGGLHAWLAAGYPIDNTPVTVTRSTLKLSLQSHPQALLADVLSYYANTTDYVLWDARSVEEYNGSRLLAMRGGHIPNAIHYEWNQALDKENSLKLRVLDEVKQELHHLGITSNKTVIVYCQTHHRSGLSYLVGKLLGLNIKAYAGSWSEWGNLRDTPVAVSSEQ